MNNIDPTVQIQGDVVQLHDQATGRKYTLRVGENHVVPGTYHVVVNDEDGALSSAALVTTTRFNSRAVRLLDAHTKGAKIH